MEGAKDVPALTEQEAAVYDRQIRVWGVEAQKRLSKARVLVAFISGAVAEACKNVVLAGVGKLTLLDDTPLTPQAAASNFLISASAAAAAAAAAAGGRDASASAPSVAETCAAALRDFNPMVSVAVSTGLLESKPEEFYDLFDVIIVGRAPLSVLRKVNSVCRKRPRHVGFYALDCRGAAGRIFADLGTHLYTLKGKEKEAPVEMKFASLEDALATPWSALPKRTPALYTALRVVDEYEEQQGKIPGSLSPADAPHLIALRNSMQAGQKGGPVSVASDGALQRIATAGPLELAPVCAILGGMLGQEVVRCVSGKGAPMNNFFLFDSAEGAGTVVRVG
eukprot:jgi/Mesen1/9675/ME000674S09280